MLMLRAIRAIRRLPLYVLSRRTGISPSRLSNIERELVVATQEERQKLAQSLRVKTGVLFQRATADALATNEDR